VPWDGQKSNIQLGSGHNIHVSDYREKFANSVAISKR
jgi:hypothetical protein